MQPTPYPAINTVLNRLLTESQDILQERFVGMYLYGSLASGDFNPESSDIDFVVITSEALPAETVRALEAMYTGMIGSGLKWANKLEGAFVPEWVIRRHTEDGPAVPTINEGNFYEAPLGSDWVIQRHIIREHSTALAGPPPASLIDLVLPDDIRASVLGVLVEWWWPMIDQPEFIRRPEYQAFAILTMCRVMHALDHGTIVSKPVAAGWAQTVVEPEWRGLIQWAMARNHGDTTDQFDNTLAFMRYVRERLEISNSL